jgi:hypothetical protein
MGLIFRREHLDLVLAGVKTATRRRHKRPRRAGRVYTIKSSWVRYTVHRIKIDRAYEQRLGDMTEKDAEKEGGYTLQEFKEVWEEVVGLWDPDEVVTVYEFHLLTG